jgi:hypothetical protein
MNMTREVESLLDQLARSDKDNGVNLEVLVITDVCEARKELFCSEVSEQADLAFIASPIKSR